jgi:hypothetical protein
MSLLPPFCLAVLALGCASAPPQKAGIWPQVYGDETYLASFDSAWSAEESVGNIRNLQNAMVEFRAGLPLSELSVDPYGLRARWTWTETTSNTQYIPTFGGFWFGTNYVPYVGDSYQTQTTTQQKSDGFVIPFDQVSSLLLEHYPALDREYRWGLIVGLSGGTAVSLRTPTRDAAERLGRAILVLARARGSNIGLPNPRFGASLGPLSQAQAQAAGISQTGGAIVLWVFKESPAEFAGFSPQDIITTVGEKAVQRPEDVFAAIDAAAASGAKELAIGGIRRSYRTEGKRRTEIFVPLGYSLAIRQAGGTK